MQNELLFALNLVVTIITIAVAFWRIAARITKMEFKLNLLWKAFKKDRGIEEDNDE